MDGTPDSLKAADLAYPSVYQRTIKAPIACLGTGLHSGHRVSLRLLPAPLGTGIVFRRTDLRVDIPARFDLVADTRLCTALSAAEDACVRIGTVEHFMAACVAAGVDNLIAEVDGPELPVFDGSADSFLFLLDCAGFAEQAAPREILRVLRRVRVEGAGDAFAELRPGPSGLDLSVSIDFQAAAIGRQALSLSFSEKSFRTELASARTFTFLDEIEALQASGLALGGNLRNAIVVDGDRVLNPEGLRKPDEFVRHKLLDVVGDLALAGSPIQGRFVANRPGHALNNALLHALFRQRDSWEMVQVSEIVSRAGYPLAA